MPVYLQTRGRTADYTFLGQAPVELWWSRYRDVTAFEYPTILVHSDGSSWKVYLSGIPSSRKDRVGTTIRYTLALEGAPEDERGRTLASGVTVAWLNDIAESPPSSRLQAALDDQFTEEFVEGIIGDREGGSASPVAEKLVRAMERLSTMVAGRVEPISGSSTASSWVGAVEKPRPRAEFKSRIQALLAGQSGRALLVNLVGTEDEACSLVEHGQNTAVLIEDGAMALGSDIVPLEKKKPSAQGRSQNRRTPQSVASRHHNPFVVAAIALGAITVVLGLILRFCGN